MKIEETVKGLRLYMNVLGKGGEETVLEELKNYEDMVNLLKRNGYVIAIMNKYLHNP